MFPPVPAGDIQGQKPLQGKDRFCRVAGQDVAGWTCAAKSGVVQPTEVIA
jgi:hypothetical protein